MLRPRIIPSLLIHNHGLVKTVNFKNPKYVGDPINAVRIFNEKQVDELAIFDIDASVNNSKPNFELLKKLANQSRMPLCYGGGVKTVNDALKIFSLGIEKIAINSGIIDNPSLISEIADRVGSQSVVAVLDVKKKFLGGYELAVSNGKILTGINPMDFAIKAQDLGAGEVIVNSIDRDGTMKGFDLELINKISSGIKSPLTVLGGAGSLSDIKKVINSHGIIGVAAGSLFVFKGPYKAVLINYPSSMEKEDLLKFS
jgi:cyclase